MEIAVHKPRIWSPRNIFLGTSILLLLAAILFLSPEHTDLWWKVLADTLHAPVFGLIAVCILAMTPPTWQLRRRIVITIAVALIIAILSEAAQIPMPGRSPSASDVANDLIGAVAFVCIAVTLSSTFHVPRGRGRWLILLAAALLILPFKPLAVTSAAYWERYQQLPSIAPLHSRNPFVFFDLTNAEVRLAHSREPAPPEFHFLETGPSRIDFHDPWSDWRPYQALILDIENLGLKTVPLTIRVHDETHLRGNQPHADRFNLALKIEPGRQAIQIDLADVEGAPFGRSMDMGRIDGVVLFATEPTADSRFVIHDLRLD